MEILELGTLTIDVILKDIKNIHLSVHPPTGRIRLSAPLHTKHGAIKLFAISKLSWIKAQQAKLLAQPRETRRNYLERESHYLWGKRYLLTITPTKGAAEVIHHHAKIELRVHGSASAQKRHDILEKWYRDELRAALPALIKKWQSLMNVEVENFYIQRMKTKWGSCNTTARNIRLNSELAKKPIECLEYIVVHEMVHLFEPSHNQRFKELMNHFLPFWKEHRNALNRLPVRHEEWEY